MNIINKFYLGLYSSLAEAYCEIFIALIEWLIENYLLIG